MECSGCGVSHDEDADFVRAEFDDGSWALFCGDCFDSMDDEDEWAEADWVASW